MMIKKITDLSEEDVKKYFPPLKKDTHKGNLGKVAIIGGSADYPGSVLLSLNALVAMKMGNGYACLCAPESLIGIYAGIHPECTFSGISDLNGRMIFNPADFSKILTFDAIGFGMGAGIDEEVYKILRFLIENYQKHLLIDADGLNVLAKYGLEVLKNKKCEIILTPHVKEFSRLTNIGVDKILENPVEKAVDFAKEYGVNVLLKSAESIITDGERVFVNRTGCPGMGKAGSGDVLSGMIVGFLGKSGTEKYKTETGSAGNGFDCADAVACAAYLFGKSGEAASKKYNDYFMTASDSISAISDVMNEIIL